MNLPTTISDEKLHDQIAFPYANQEIIHRGFRTREFRLNRFSCSPCSQHEGFEVFRTKSDKQRLRIDDKTIALIPGQLVITNCLAPHGVIEGNGEFQAVTLESQFFQDLFADTDFNPANLSFSDPSFSWTPKINQMFDDLVSARIGVLEDSFDIDVSIVNFILMLLTTTKHNGQKALSEAMLYGRFPSPTHKAMNLLKESATNPQLSLDRIAREAGLSKFQFVRVFQRVTGYTPVFARNLLRISAAKKELKRGKLSVTEIAFSSGFNDLSSFNKAFKRITGCSPSQFTKSN
jgi:AraC-like DNA-binding protein